MIDEVKNPFDGIRTLKRYKVRLAGGMEYTGYIAPYVITDTRDEHRRVHRTVSFGLYSTQVGVSELVFSQNGKDIYNTKIIPLYDNPDVMEIVELDE